MITTPLSASHFPARLKLFFECVSYNCHKTFYRNRADSLTMGEGNNIRVTATAQAIKPSN